MAPKKLLLIIGFFYVSFLSVFSQAKRNIADLEKQVFLASDSEKGDLYNKITEAYWKSNPKLAIESGKKAVYYYRKYKKDDKINYAYYNLARAYYFNSQLDSCFFYSEIILKNNDHSPDSESFLDKAYYLKSLAYRKLGNLDKAISFAKKSLAIRERMKDTIRIAEIMGSISNVYKRAGKYSEALSFIYKSVTYYETLKDSSGLQVGYYGIADLYMYLKKYDLAKQNYQKSTSYIKDSANLIMADIINSMGALYFETQKLDSALHYYKKALRIYQLNHSVEGVAIARENQGEVYAKLGQYKKGIRLLKKAERVYKKLDYSFDLTSVYNIMGDTYHGAGKKDSARYYYKKSYKLADRINYADRKILSLENLYKLSLEDKDTIYAFLYFKKLITYKDSIQLHENKMQVMELEKKYQTEKKQKEIEFLEHKQRLQKANFNTLLVASFGSLIVLLFIGFSVFLKRKKERIITSLELEKSQIINQNLKNELEIKNKQLTTHALNMMQKNQLLSAFGNDLSDISRDVEGDAKSKLKRLKREVNHLLNSEKDWDTFKVYFEQVNKDFLEKLQEKGTGLTTNDVRLATLIKLNMTNKEIASILNITYQSVKNAQYRLKNKILRDSTIDLRKFLRNL